MTVPELPPDPDPIVVVPYDPAWPARFAELARPLRAALGPLALRIDHIGSTAVAGLAAKPIIDIQVSVADFEPWPLLLDPLEALGWRFRPDNPDLTRRYFREAPGTPRTHLHVRRAGSFSQQVPLLFRDFLRVTPAAAQEYAAAKYRLARQFRGNRLAYVDAKGPIVWAILSRASDWSQLTGWQPGPSDA